MPDDSFPMRLNKYLARNNVCSRREADELIAAEKVTIDGKVARLGSKVESEKSLVEVFFRKGKQKELVYLAFNKPRGVTSHSPQQGEKEISDILDFPIEVYPVGRLDRDSSGLILLTNDGRVTDKLLNPERKHEKEYLVRVDKEVTEGFLNKMKNGVTLDDGYVTQKCEAREINENQFALTLTEGKKHQIRRMCAELGFQVKELKRVRIMGLRLGKIPAGRYREITGSELKDFLGSIGL
jgi:23S rRNA pseudouridine2604 synthase